MSDVKPLWIQEFFIFLSNLGALFSWECNFSFSFFIIYFFCCYFFRKSYSENQRQKWILLWPTKDTLYIKNQIFYEGGYHFSLYFFFPDAFGKICAVLCNSKKITEEVIWKFTFRMNLVIATQLSIQSPVQVVLIFSLLYWEATTLAFV